jgi:FtsH-binding integral membrane protein
MTNFDVDSLMQSPAYQQELGAQRTFMARVFGWMTIGLLTTALIALALSTVVTPQMFAANRGTFLILMIVQFGIAMAMGFMVNKMPAALAAILFLLYSAITGIVFSILFLVYTSSSIAATFFITAGMFGAMAAIGYTTKRDLTSLGTFLIMGLIGIVIASIVNMFMMSSGLSWFISFAGVIIFTGLTAYDVQKIKQAYAVGEYGTAAFERTAVFGAFTLYLDFINLFLYLLRFLGSRRD